MKTVWKVLAGLAGTAAAVALVPYKIEDEDGTVTVTALAWNAVINKKDKEECGCEDTCECADSEAEACCEDPQPEEDVTIEVEITEEPESEEAPDTSEEPDAE